MKLFGKIFAFLFVFCIFVSTAHAQQYQIGQYPNGAQCYGNPYCASGYCNGTCQPFPTSAPAFTPTPALHPTSTPQPIASPTPIHSIGPTNPAPAQGTNPALTPPTNLSPNGTASPGPTTLTWTASPNAQAGYYIRVNDETGMNTGVSGSAWTDDCSNQAVGAPNPPTTGGVCRIVIGTSYSYNFKAGHTYHWWVHSRGTDGSWGPSADAYVTAQTTNTSCALHSRGDANCDGIINILDFNAWRDDFLRFSNPAVTPIPPIADFNGDGTVNILDFNIWHDGFLGLGPTSPAYTPTPTVSAPGGGNPTSTPVPPTIFVNPPATLTPTPRPPTPTTVIYPTSTPAQPTPTISTSCGPGEYYYNGGCIPNPPF